jgi:hypothetical protein
MAQFSKFGGLSQNATMLEDYKSNVPHCSNSDVSMSDIDNNSNSSETPRSAFKRVLSRQSTDKSYVCWNDTSVQSQTFVFPTHLTPDSKQRDTLIL